RKAEMFFNIIMPFIMIYAENDKVKNFLNFIFENHPPLTENKLIKSFKRNYPEYKIDNVKTYMGAILFQTQGSTDEES
ncbi:MAG: hypothetical protein ACPL25_05285, partial [Ignavibacteria bacterium]